MNVASLLGTVANIAQIVSVFWLLLFSSATLIDVWKKITSTAGVDLFSPPRKKRYFTILTAITPLIITSLVAFFLNGSVLPDSNSSLLTSSTNSIPSSLSTVSFPSPSESVPSRSTPLPIVGKARHILQQFCADVLSSRYQQAYDELLDEQTKRSNRDFVTRWRKVSPTKCLVTSATQITEDQAVCIIMYASYESPDYQIKFIVDDLATPGVWKITSWESV